MAQRKNRTFSKEVKNHVLALCQAGKMPQDIERLTNVPAGTVIRWFKQFLKVPKGASPKRYSQEIKDKAIELYKQGKSTTDIHEELGVNASLAWRWVSKAGIARPQAETCHVRRLPMASHLNRALKLAVKHIKCSECPVVCPYRLKRCTACEVVILQHLLDQTR